MIVYVLVVWFGTGNTQSSFSVPNIQTAAECQRLGNEMSHTYTTGFGRTSTKCFAYRAGR